MGIIADESAFHCARSEAWLLVARQVDKGITAPDAQAGKVGRLTINFKLSRGTHICCASRNPTGEVQHWQHACRQLQAHIASDWSAQLCRSAEGCEVR